MALADGVFQSEISEVNVHDTEFVNKDDNMAPYDVNKLSELPTPWGSTVSRASASKLADGAAACVLMNEHGLSE
jgi:acetyl-CoA acetyltransferase